MPIFSDSIMYKFSASVLFLCTKKKQTLCKSERLQEIGCLFQYIDLGINPEKDLSYLQMLMRGNQQFERPSDFQQYLI